MRSRRQFIAWAGGAAAWPIVARAQQTARTQRVGVLVGYGEGDPEGQSLITAFRQELQKLGWIDESKLRIDVRYAVAAERGLLETCATQLLALKPDAILAHGRRALAAIQHQDKNIPIVFATIVDPVGEGIVESLARPGANVTGFSIFESSLIAKLMEALKEIAPNVTRVALIHSPDLPTWATHWRLLESVASSFAVKAIAAPARTPSEMKLAFKTLASEPNGGLVVPPDLTLATHRDLIIELAGQYRLPAVYTDRLYVAAGGLMSYGASVSDNYRRAASYIDRILKGARPADLPVQQPTTFQLAINLKTAKALGLTAPSTLLARADEVIE